jgi:LL-diaminopimelate aminotransferase
LVRKGFEKVYSDSTFYVWVKIPGRHPSSIGFARKLLDRGVVATPGVGFGAYGEGFIRFALTVDVPALKKALALL